MLEFEVLVQVGQGKSRWIRDSGIGENWGEKKLLGFGILAQVGERKELEL